MGFNKYAAGNKTYGGGRPMPTVGPVDPLGYAERDAGKTNELGDEMVMRNAALRKLMAMKNKNYFSADAQRGPM